MMKSPIHRGRRALGALVLLICGCASQAPAPRVDPAAQAAADAAAARESALACTLPTNCVNTLAGSSLEPLRYVGTAAEAMALLRTTLAGFPEARIVRSDGLTLEAVFTTPVGFRDVVDFRIDGPAQRIDYRSGSSFGLFDFGKNRSRMAEFASRFETQARR